MAKTMMRINSPLALAAYARSQRKKLKLSQAALGDQVGLTQKTISLFENNPEAVYLQTALRILSALELDLALIEKNESMIKSEQWDEEW